MNIFGKISFFLLIICIALFLGVPIFTLADQSSEAQDVTSLSVVESEQEEIVIRRMHDNRVKTYSQFAECEELDISWPEEANVRMVYIKWFAPPESFTLTQTDAANTTLIRETISSPQYNDCYSILSAAHTLTLSSVDGMTISELSLYSKGVLPEKLHDWLPPCEKADLLVISAHCDDEMLFFGGTIPYYAGERGLAVQIAYIANGDRQRADEALAGLWHAGVRHEPLFLPFKDVYSETLHNALVRWGEEEVMNAFVSIIRRFHPEVILTHDLNGEYGHGAHMAAAACTLKAISLAADSSLYPNSVEEFGVWQTQKLYLHLFTENPITMDWNQPLTEFEGKTALQVANESFHLHTSQRDYYPNVYSGGAYSSLEFGLAYSAVGLDLAKDDFFEHINPTRLSDFVLITPVPVTPELLPESNTK